jgi:predicted metal-binding membrane protein
MDNGVQTLSGGELQRCAIVLCLGTAADIYLVSTAYTAHCSLLYCLVCCYCVLLLVFAVGVHFDIRLALSSPQFSNQSALY